MKPWEITIDEARAAGKRMRTRLEAADQFAAPLLARQLADDPLPEDADDEQSVETKEGL